MDNSRIDDKSNEFKKHTSFKFVVFVVGFIGVLGLFELIGGVA